MAGLMDDGWPPAPLQHLSQDLPPTRLHACQARLGAPGAATAPALCHLHASRPIHPITHRLHEGSICYDADAEGVARASVEQTALNFKNKDPASKKRTCVALSDSLFGCDTGVRDP